MKSVIVTGATGAIGNALIEFLKNAGMDINVVVRKGSSRNSGILSDKNIKVIECGLENIKTIKDSVGKCDVFFHLGWADTDKEGRNSAEKQRKNIDYTLAAVEAASSVGCTVFVGAGSQAEYGRYNVPICEDFALKPETEYGRAKAEACVKSRELCLKTGIRHVWTRIFSVYGPHDAESTLIMYLIKTLLKDEKPALSACTQTWDYLYSADCARALFLLAEKGINGEVYNIGGGECRKLIEYVKILRDVINPKAQLGLGEVKTPPEGLMNLCADISKLKRDTGFMPQLNFEDGIKETIKWVKGV
ncbi:MAG: NAD(P)-dependent oxidoreductase [Candidatus Goldiibacteriota bacterium HGW-Goldbacteria-1]|nr:MAG: NAD(P)-dependent oxidoreductase [Candidatus Goldiibacteriota bacterium HGW-Goldbacteria-1]